MRSLVEEAARRVEESTGLPLSTDDVVIEMATGREAAAAALEGTARLLAERRSGLRGALCGLLECRLLSELEDRFMAAYRPRSASLVIAREHPRWASRQHALAALKAPLTRAAIDQRVPAFRAEFERRRTAIDAAREAHGRGSPEHARAVDAYQALDAIVSGFCGSFEEDALPEGLPRAPHRSLAAWAAQQMPQDYRAQALVGALPQSLLGAILERPPLADLLYQSGGRVEVPVVDDDDEAAVVATVAAVRRARGLALLQDDVDVAYVRGRALPE